MECQWTPAVPAGERWAAGSTMKAHAGDGGDDSLSRLATLSGQVAAACGFARTPPIVLRRGGGGDWSPSVGVIRIGARELGGTADRLWSLLAHELAHAQAEGREGHTRAFWCRLAEGLRQAGRLELLRLDIGYREGALRTAREYGLDGLPTIRPFAFERGDVFVDGRRRWVIARRFRRAGAPAYRLLAPRWAWSVTEDALVRRATRAPKDARSKGGAA